MSLDFISSSSATKLPFDVWSCFIEIFGHVFPPRPFFRSRVSVVLESVDYLHLPSYPTCTFRPSFFPRRTFVGHGFFFNRVICMMPAGLHICSCFRSFQVQLSCTSSSLSGRRSDRPPRSQPFISLSSLRTRPSVHIININLSVSRKNIFVVCVRVQGKVKDV